MRSFRSYTRQVHARTRLQGRLRRLGSLARAAGLWPRGDWLRLVREAGGQTLTEVAARLGVSPSSVLRVETCELRGNIRLDTLRRVAGALDCEVFYSLVPRVAGSLDVAVLRRQRRDALLRQLEALPVR
jgi:transcriptional regulator with XRE-family HTH domain